MASWAFFSVAAPRFFLNFDFYILSPISPPLGVKVNYIGVRIYSFVHNSEISYSIDTSLVDEYTAITEENE